MKILRIMLIAMLAAFATGTIVSCEEEVIVQGDGDTPPVAPDPN